VSSGDLLTVPFSLAMLLGAIIIFSLNPMKISFGYDNNNLGAGEVHYIGTNENDEAPQGLDLLEICCSWSNELSDAVLTYAFVDVDGIDQSAKHAVEDAIEEWDSKIEELELEEVQLYPSASDIQITFESLGGIENGERDYNFKNNIDDHLTIIPTAGWTQFKFTNQGLIKGVKITISDDVLDLGFDDDIIEQIAKHEMGHALGLGHAHDEERLMADIVIEDRTGDVSECEIYGVLQANQWKLVNAKDTAGPPMRKYINC
jgi:hypothetical protein